MQDEEKIMSLFEGMKEAHGEFVITDAEEKKKTGQARTIREEVTASLWDQHLRGAKTLGIIPINAQNMCLWGAIDIDDYDLDIVTFSIRVHKKKLPLVPCRSKSGGLHLVMFMKELVPAADLQNKLSEIAAAIGYGKSEIFPKQTKVLVDKGDLGNWLNMPYFGGNNGSRYAIDAKGEALKLKDFFALADKLKVSIKELKKLDLATNQDLLPDGPPCLQSLTEQGFPQGTRNNGLFALAVYCRKAYPDNWEAELEKLNKECMDPPLESKEVQIIVKQAGKKDYNYKCNDQPICSFCNATLCRTRQYGIGGGALPAMKSLRKIPTDQPIWFLEVNGTTLELTTDQLQQQVKFQKACMEFINFMPPKVSDRQWQNLIQMLLDSCVDLEKPKEAGIGDQFLEHVEMFCTDSRLRANSKEELLLGRPWAGLDPDGDETTRVYFRLMDLEDYMTRKGFKYYTRSQITSKLGSRDIEARPHFFKIKGRGVNVWHVSEPDTLDGTFELPEMGENAL